MNNKNIQLNLPTYKKLNINVSNFNINDSYISFEYNDDNNDIKNYQNFIWNVNNKNEVKYLNELKSTILFDDDINEILLLDVKDNTFLFSIIKK